LPQFAVFEALPLQWFDSIDSLCNVSVAFERPPSMEYNDARGALSRTHENFQGGETFEIKVLLPVSTRTTVLKSSHDPIIESARIPPSIHSCVSLAMSDTGYGKYSTCFIFITQKDTSIKGLFPGYELKK
jgi:hypothetical protein